MEAQLSPGVTYEEIDQELIGEFYKCQKGFKKGFIRIQPANQVFPRVFLNHEKRIKDFNVKADDVWIGSFPKTGTTWTEEMVWLLQNDLDFEEAKKTTLDNRIPYFDLIGVMSPDDEEPSHDTVTITENLPSPRLIKTHLSMQMLPENFFKEKPKLIYVTRNPRDVCVSYYNHWKILEGFTGSFEVFANAFLDDVCGYYTPFFQHVKEFWTLSKESDSNMIFLTYEEMKKDLRSVVIKMGQFLGKPLQDEEKIKQLLDHLSFDKMKGNSAVNKKELVEQCNKEYGAQFSNQSFMRSGKTGNWREHFTPELIKRFEEWEAKWLQDTDLKFQYD